MRKHILLRCWLMLCLAFVGITASAADPGVIYLVDWNKTYNGAPLQSNEDQFSKLYETEAGSRFYVGLHEFSQMGGIFRFYSSLQEGPEVNWKLNNICPLKDMAPLAELGKSGVLTADNVHDTKLLSPYEESGTWRMTTGGNYQVTVDLNAGTLELLPTNDPLVLIDNPNRPSKKDWSNLSAMSSLMEYINAGNHKIYLYYPYHESWSKSEQNILYNGLNPISGSLDKNTPSAYELNNWPGGTLYNKYSTFYLYADRNWNPGHIKSDKVYLLSNVNDMTFSEDYAFAATDSEGYKFNITIPAGTRYFMLTSAPSWDGFIFSPMSVTQQADGKFNVEIQNSGNNFVFDSNLTNDLDCQLDLSTMTLTLPASAPLTASPVNDYSNVLFFNTYDNELNPWKDAPKSVMDYQSTINKVSNNEWNVKIRLNTNDYRFNLISELTEQGKPNRVIAPSAGKDITLSFTDGFAYASGSVQAQDVAPYWQILDAEGKTLELTVTRDGDKFTLKIDDASQAVQNAQIYLIGQPNGWRINDDSMPLQLTTNGGYYGSYSFPSGQNYFRFYTELGDWGMDYQLPSIGASPVDGNNTSVELYDTYRGYCTEGKGSWVIESDGEPIFFYVDLNHSNVIFSKEPIDEAGEVITNFERNPVKEGLFVEVNGGKRMEFEKISEGIYSLTTNEIYYGTYELRFFNKTLPISSDEPEWLGSYTVSFKNDAVADFTEKKTAEFDLTLNNAISTTPATPLTLVLGLESVNPTLNFIVDLNKNKMYVADFETCVALDFDAENPTALTADKVADRLLPWNGAILNVPAGKFDLRYYNAGLANFIPTETVTLDFSKNSFNVEPLWFNTWRNKRVTAPDWKGGPVLLTTSSALDMRSINTIYAQTPTDSTYNNYPLKETAPGSMIYKGTVEVPATKLVSQCLGFLLYEQEMEIDGEKRSYSFQLGSGCLYIGTGGEGDESLRNLPVVDKKAEGKLYIGGTNYRFSNLKGAGKFDVTVNLNTMEMTATLIEGATTTRFETVEDTESPLDGAQSYATGSTCYLEAPEIPAKEGDYGFNLVTDRNTTLVPANGANTPLSFDATGTWTGQYKEVPSVAAQQAPAASRRGVLRQAAAQQPKWSFSIPEVASTDLIMAIDEASKTITIHSAAHNKGFFIVRDYNMPRVDEIAEAAKHMLLPTDDAEVLEGTFFVTEPTIEWSTIMFSSIPYTRDTRSRGIAGDTDFSNRNLDITSGTATVNAWDKYLNMWDNKVYALNAFDFSFSAQPGKYKAVYNKRENTLSISTYSGIEEVVDDAANGGVRILPGNGCATIVAEKTGRVDFYAVNGALVKSVDVKAGSTTVALAPGFYIAAGNKIAVK